MRTLIAISLIQKFKIRDGVDPENTLEPLFARRISTEAIDLLRKCLVADASKRLTMTEVLKHPWFKVIHKQ